MKTISQSKAWTLLAGIWKKPIPVDSTGWWTNIECIVKLNDNTYAGLCDCINKLYDDGLIRETVRNRMSVAAVGPCKGYGFRWKPTYQGAKQRANFCLKMAKLTKRKSPAMAT